MPALGRVAVRTVTLPAIDFLVLSAVLVCLGWAVARVASASFSWRNVFRLPRRGDFDDFMFFAAAACLGWLACRLFG